MYPNINIVSQSDDDGLSIAMFIAATVIFLFVLICWAVAFHMATHLPKDAEIQFYPNSKLSKSTAVLLTALSVLYGPFSVFVTLPVILGCKDFDNKKQRGEQEKQVPSTGTDAAAETGAGQV